VRVTQGEDIPQEQDWGLPWDKPEALENVGGDLLIPDDDDFADEEEAEAKGALITGTKTGRGRDKLAPWLLKTDRDTAWAKAAHRRFVYALAYLQGMMSSLPEADYGKISAVATDEDHKL
jgi:hypothetical protein